MTVRAFSFVPCALLLASCGGAPADDGAGAGTTDEAALSAIAPGCTAATPKWIGGVVYGEDSRAINVQISVTWADANNTALDATGVHPRGTPGTKSCGGYSNCIYPNPTLPAAGAAAGVKTWGQCVGPHVTRAWIELYPKNEGGHTDFARYGEAVDNQVLTFDAQNRSTVGLRLPLRWDMGGDTGFVRGSVTCHGQPVTPTVLRAWSNDAGTACGIEGFAASGTASLGHYELNWLAAGQCHAPDQLYQVRVTLPCDGASHTVTDFVRVPRAWEDSIGAWHGATLDISYP